MTRGALYMVWPGDDRIEPMLHKSIASLHQHHPDMPIEVARLPEGSTLLDKAAMMERSPFDTTMFIDADTVVLGNLDFAYQKAEQFGLALCICECPWARRFGALLDRGDIVEYNTGIVWFTKGACEVFEAWQRLIAIDTSIKFEHESQIHTMPNNDQGAFAAAIDETGFNPFVLPLNWNFRPRWQLTAFGPIKIWHDYAPVPQHVIEWNATQNTRVIGCAKVVER